MKKCLTILAFVMVAASANAQKSVEIFNGKNLNGWSLFTKDMGDIPSETYRVVDKTIEASGDYGYIYTNEEYSNYKLTMEWRWVEEGSNSGLFINMQGENKTWPSCYEIQLKSGQAGAIFHVSGAESDEFKSGTKNKSALRNDLEKTVGEWNKVEVINTPSKVTVYINGKKHNEINNITQSSGHIGLQSEGGPIQFRNIKLTPIK